MAPREGRKNNETHEEIKEYNTMAEREFTTQDMLALYDFVQRNRGIAWAQAIFGDGQLTVADPPFILESGNRVERIENHAQQVISNEDARSHHRVSNRRSKKFAETVGKRRARRQENDRQLEAFARELGENEEPCWDFSNGFRFTQMPAAIISEFLNGKEENEEFSGESDTSGKEKKLPGKPSIEIGSPEEAFSNLTPFEREFFSKRHVPTGMVEYLEDALKSFFVQEPTGVYVSQPLSSFERVILHALAHYYRLRSTSKLTTQTEMTTRLV